MFRRLSIFQKCGGLKQLKFGQNLKKVWADIAICLYLRWNQFRSSWKKQRESPVQDPNLCTCKKEKWNPKRKKQVKAKSKVLSLPGQRSQHQESQPKKAKLKVIIDKKKIYVCLLYKKEKAKKTCFDGFGLFWIQELFVRPEKF